VTDQVAKNTLLLTIASIGQKIIAFVYFLFLARIMMPDATGQYYLALSVTTIFSVVADFGLTPVVIREIAKDHTRAKSILAHAMGLKVPFMGLAACGAILAGKMLGYSISVQWLIAFATVVLMLDALHLLFYGVLRGYQNLRIESIGVFTGMMTTAIVGAFVLWFHPTLTFLVFALFCGSSMNVIIAGWKVVRQIGWAGLMPAYSTTTLWLLKTAIPFALAAVFIKVYSYVDTIFISKYLDTIAVGLYAVAYKFTYAFQFLPLAFTAALYPGMSALAQKDTVMLEKVLHKSLWYMAIISAPIVFGLYAVAPEAVALAGDSYGDAARVLKVLVFVLIPIFLDFPVGSLLNASGYQSVKTTIMGVTMIINVALNALLIPLLGILGAAYAAIVSFTFLFGAGLFVLPRIIPSLSYVSILKKLLPIYLSAAIMLMMVLVLKPLIGWVLVIPLGGIVYLAGLVISGSIKRNDFLVMKRL